MPAIEFQALEQSKDKVLEIRSDKSVAGLTPNIWYVVYLDPDVASKRAQVKFGAGRQMGLKHNWRPFGGGGSAACRGLRALPTA